MTNATFDFQLLHVSGDGEARAGLITTPHGTIETPVFMPVGTAAAMKAMTPRDVKDCGAQIILANTYHLSIRPGEALIKKAGGLHRFMGWDLPILTDSGGFQVFSLDLVRLDDQGVVFRYEKDGQSVELTPERSIRIQEDLGADIIMCFDQCVPHDVDHHQAKEAGERTIRWARICKEAHHRADQALFGIVQGATFPELRERSARAMAEIGFAGYAIGGLSVGEGFELMCKTLELTVPFLPYERPRYLMGVGLPTDILAAVERGVDMFDCVIPTRYARSATALGFQGKLRVSAKACRKDLYAVDTSCACYCCRNFSRAYLYHLFHADELLGPMLLAIHNVHFYQQLMARIRAAIAEDRFGAFREEFLARYGARDT